MMGRRANADSTAIPAPRRPPAASLKEAVTRARRENRRVLVVWSNSGTTADAELRRLLTEDGLLAGKVRREYEAIWADPDSLDADPGMAALFQAEPSVGPDSLPRLLVLDGAGEVLDRRDAHEISGEEDREGELFQTRLLFSLLLEHQAPYPDAAANIEEAQNQARESDRLVFLYFTEPNCELCELLAAWIERPAVKPVWDRVFVTVRVDISRSVNGMGVFASHLGQRRRMTGLPWFAVLKPSGRVLGNAFLMQERQNVGYPWTEEEILAFQDLLERRVKDLTEEERAMLSAELRSARQDAEAAGFRPTPPPQ
jgi:sirohydrochlorin ferrochelatase